MHKRYDLILADPPWNWKAYSKKGEDRSAKNHYPVMKLQDIKDMPIGQLAAANSVLLMWATDPLLDRAFEVITAWGFKYKTVGFYWAKKNKKADTFFMGNGYYTRANPEICLLATRGKGLHRYDAGVPRLIVSRRGRHSEKPTESHRGIERLFGEVDRLELFARCRQPGWDAFGNEVEGSIKLPSPVV